MNRRFYGLVISIAIAAFGLFTPAMSDQVGNYFLDQINSPNWNGAWTNIIPDNHVGQAFVPSRSPLTSVEVGIKTVNSGRGSDNLTITITDDQGYDLFSDTLSVDAGFDGWLRFNIPKGGIVVDTNKTYTIYIEDSGKIGFGWKYNTDFYDTYPHGYRKFFGQNEPGDYFFKVYTSSMPPASPELHTQLNGNEFHQGQIIKVTASLTPSAAPIQADAYVVVRLPDGSFLSSQLGGGFVPGIVPIVRGFVPFSFSGELLHYTFGGGEPAGDYVWFSALTEPGTLNVIGTIEQDAFTFWPGSPAITYIPNIKTFLDQCPTNDPVYTQIMSDFRILRDGVPVGIIPCSEPVSSLALAQYTDQLILAQGLRVLYYMDRGQSNHLPWTSLTVYDWMKTKIRGFNISSTATLSSCCERIGDELYVTITAQNDTNRDLDRKWQGISGNIGLYAHEVRHRDGFLHDSACGISGGCDPIYDESNLSPYGIQWWLDAKWLSGDLYVGFSCLDSASVADIANWLGPSANGFRRRFSVTLPPLLTMPAQPGGKCRP